VDRIIGACGIVCSECPAYVATQADDADAIAKTAAEWSAQFDAEIKPEDIWCDGCFAESGRVCVHAGECDIRACVVERELANCAHCDDYGCEKITKFTEFAPEVKEVLDGIRAEL
jgi:hypothetical protein